MLRSESLVQLQKGVAAIRAGNNVLAQRLLTELLERDPGNEFAWQWLASVAKTPQEAERCWQQVLAINPINERALAELRSFQDKKGKGVHSWECPLCKAVYRQQVFKCLACGAVLTLGDLDVLLNNDDVNQGRIRQAINHLLVAAGKDKDFAIQYHLGLAYLNLKQVGEAIQCLRAASQMQPENKILPAFVGMLAQRQAEHEAAGKKETTQTTVLVVDDSPTVVAMVSTRLSKHGLRVISAADGIEALAKIREAHVILLDINMPRMDGYQLCKLVKETPETAQIPVILVSGKDGILDKARGKMVGANDYLTKPFGEDALLEMIKKHCLFRTQ